MERKLWEHTRDTCIDISGMISVLPLSGDLLGNVTLKFKMVSNGTQAAKS